MVWSEGNMSLKNPVTPPGIDPGTIQLVAQHLNHYATPGPNLYLIAGKFVHSHPACVGVSGHLQSPSFYTGGKNPLSNEYKGGWAVEPA
jgi:hypothetical protein